MLTHIFSVFERSLFRRIIVLYSLLASFTVPFPVLANDAPEWRTLYLQGEEALNEQDLTEAEQRFQKALSLVQKQSAQPQDTEKCMLKLADTLALSYKTDQALNLYEKLLKILVNRYGSTSAQLAPVLVALGSIEESEGNHAAAMGYYRKAFSIYEKNYGPYSPVYANALHRLAITSYKSGHKAEAQRHYEQARSILQQEPGLEASKQLESLTREYGDLMKGNDRSNQDLIRDFQVEIMGKPEIDKPSPDSNRSKDDIQINQLKRQAPQVKSRQNYQGEQKNDQQTRASIKDGKSFWQEQNEILLRDFRLGQTDENSQIALRGITQPASNATLSPAYKVLNDTVFKQNHYEKSESYSKRMIAVDIDALGPNHPSVANDLSGLALLYVEQERYSEAEPLLKQALSIYKQIYGLDNLLTINTMANLAAVEFHLGHNDQSAQLYSGALSQAQQALGPNGAETARILNGLALVYFRQGNLLKSCTLYQWAIASTEAAAGKDSPLLAASLKDYAQVLRSLGREADAIDAESRSAKILANSK